MILGYLGTPGEAWTSHESLQMLRTLCVWRSCGLRAIVHNAAPGGACRALELLCAYLNIQCGKLPARGDCALCTAPDVSYVVNDAHVRNRCLAAGVDRVLGYPITRGDAPESVMA